MVDAPDDSAADSRRGRAVGLIALLCLTRFNFWRDCPAKVRLLKLSRRRRVQLHAGTEHKEYNAGL